MERESNQLEANPILCRTGCGFFGSPNTDGLCSQCYKDALKKKQQPPTTLPPSCSTPSIVTPVSTIASSLPLSGSVALPPSPAADSADKLSDSTLEAIPEDESGSPDKEGSKKKKSKCQTCKKKVGLTGFTCRCGGLFCSVHRYSNEHHCTFDYRELGAEEIRRNNPVIKGEKIQKI